MAYTVVNTPSTFGNKKVSLLKITADAATQTIQTGLGVIEHFAVGFTSMSTQAIKFSINSNTSGVQSFGVLGLTGLVAGDELYVTVFGR